MQEQRPSAWFPAFGAQDTDLSPLSPVSVYEVDDALLANSELRIREFYGVDAAWLDFVVGCRKGQKHDYDLVFDPVANDNVFVIVNLYESGVLDAQTAIARLKAYKTYDQLSFHTEKVIKAIRFVESIEVWEKQKLLEKVTNKK